jgi:hypothetical protein
MEMREIARLLATLICSLQTGTNSGDCFREAGAGGSNPLTPTSVFQEIPCFCADLPVAIRGSKRRNAARTGGIYWHVFRTRVSAAPDLFAPLST